MPRTSIALLPALIFLALCISGCGRWSSRDRGLTIERGNRIVLALGEYKKDHLGYPKTLDELIPRYLPTIPDPVVGNRIWVYEEVTSKSFALHVTDDTSYPANFLTYYQNGNRWEFLLE